MTSSSSACTTGACARIFGYPGRRHQRRARRARSGPTDKIEFVQARHEEMAAFMACAYAKFTGELGVCLSTGGPGATHLITGPLRRQARPHAGARHHRPGAAHGARRALPAGAQPRPHCSPTSPTTCRKATAPAQVRHHRRPRDAHRASAEQRGGGGDHAQRPVRTAATKSRRARTATLRSGVGYTQPQRRALRRPTCARRRGAERRQEGRDPGRRRRAAAPPTKSSPSPTACRPGAAKALLGKAALPDDLPWVTGTIGLLGTKPQYDMMDDCDTLLMVGTGFP